MQILKYMALSPLGPHGQGQRCKSNRPNIQKSSSLLQCMWKMHGFDIPQPVINCEINCPLVKGSNRWVGPKWP